MRLFLALAFFGVSLFSYSCDPSTLVVQDDGRDVGVRDGSEDLRVKDDVSKDSSSDAHLKGDDGDVVDDVDLVNDVEDASAPFFENLEKRPVLTNPTLIYLSKSEHLKNSVAYNACAGGQVYSVSLDDEKDYLIKMKEGEGALPYPLFISGGRKVLIQGLSIKLEIQPGSEAGSRTLSTGEKTIHPTAVSCRALGLLPKKSEYYIEGALIDVNGHDGDAIIPNGIAESKLTVVNSLITGIETSHDIHGDILQTQSGEMGTIIFENVTMEQSGEGMVISFPVHTFNMRNINYKSDPRFDSDDALDDQNGGFFADYSDSTGAKVTDFSLENINITYKSGVEKWFIIANKHISSEADAGQKVYGMTTESHPEVHFNHQPKVDFAPRNLVGIDYRIP